MGKRRIIIVPPILVILQEVRCVGILLKLFGEILLLLGVVLRSVRWFLDLPLGMSKIAYADINLPVI
jgi:hypothetical protein